MFFLSCSKTSGIRGDVHDDDSLGVDSVDVEVEYLVASSVGDTLAFDIDVEGPWRIAPMDTYDWLTMLKRPSGEGCAQFRFAIKANYTGDRRAAVFSLFEGDDKLLDIHIIQDKMVIPLCDGDFEFLKWLVDNKAYGSSTPKVDWFMFDGTGFPAINFDVDATGKYYIKDIDIRADASNADMMFNSFPPEISLRYITSIYVNYTAMGTTMDAVNCPLKGSEFPSVWDCPKLERVHLECVGMVGVIPQSFADLPNLRAFFVRSCDLYGSLPQKWASNKFESIVLGFNGISDCPNLGYMVPAQLDVILNSEKPKSSFHADRNEFKLGGYRDNWIGFEEGWGQTRYEKFDSQAEKGNLSVWSKYRMLSKGTEEEIAPGGIRNPLGTSDIKYVDSWESYYSNITSMPFEMCRWNQADADAYTAKAAKCDRLYVR